MQRPFGKFHVFQKSSIHSFLWHCKFASFQQRMSASRQVCKKANFPETTEGSALVFVACRAQVMQKSSRMYNHTEGLS